MYCVTCGTPIPEGELICDECSRLSANVRDEVLAMTEELKSGSTCKTCGAATGKSFHFCNKCGAPVS
jgi:predicted nucleic acid-binding Zn ribbon protein